MNIGRLALTVVGILSLATSCQKLGIGWPGSTHRLIIPKVSSVSSSKASGIEDDGKWIATYTLSEDPENPLYVHVFEKDIIGHQFDMPTKGTEVTSDRLNNDIKLFYMSAYADGEWYDNTIASGEAGSSTTPNAKGMYFGGTDGISVSKGTGEWNMATEQYWINNVPLSFWSWYDVKPTEIVWNGSRYDKAILTDFTVNSAVTSQTDPIFAYNGETREFDKDGQIKSVTGTATTSEKNDINIHFYHALSEIKFDVSGVASNLYVSNATINNIYSKGDCEITVDGSGKLVFDWDDENLEDPASFSQDFGESDFDSSGKLGAAAANKVYFLIPQTLAANGSKEAASITVSFKSKYDDSPKGTNTARIDRIDGEDFTWQAGKYYTYRFSKSSDSSSASITIDPNEWHDGSGNIGF